LLQRGPELPGPTNILRGNGKGIRSIAVDSPDTMQRADVTAIIDAVLQLAVRPMHPSNGPQLVIKSVNAKPRPRQ